MKQASMQRIVIAGLLSPCMLLPAGVALALPSTEQPLLAKQPAPAKQPPVAQPPLEEVPEEVLRTQIILDARSPIDGKPMSPVEFAEFQAKQQASLQPPGTVAREVRGVVGSLRLRRFIKKFLPFIPIK